MGVLRLKPGAGVSNPAPAGFRILSALDQFAATRPTDVYITSGNEAEWRAPTDPHQTGEAFDISVKGWEPPEIVRAYKFLGGALGPLFTVLFEVPSAVADSLPPLLRDIAYRNADATGMHFHIQRRKGTTYPPPTTRA